MRTYHPESWSKQARRLSERIANNVRRGNWTYAEASNFWSKSYRHPLIVHRAAKRFGRLKHMHKV